MNLLKDFKLHWWQAGLFKICLLSLGIIIGVYFKSFFVGLIPVLWIIFIVLAVYLTWVWFKQIKG